MSNEKQVILLSIFLLAVLGAYMILFQIRKWIWRELSIYEVLGYYGYIRRRFGIFTSARAVIIAVDVKTRHIVTFDIPDKKYAPIKRSTIFSFNWGNIKWQKPSTA